MVVPTPCSKHRDATLHPCCVILSLWVSLTHSVVTQGSVGVCSIQKTQAMAVQRDMGAAGAGWALRSILTQATQ